MKIQERSGGVERRTCIAMVVCQPVLARISGRWEKGGLFRSPWANMVGQWCVDYFSKYSKAPGKAIVALFEEWQEAGQDKDTVSLIDRFLTSISAEFAQLKKDINPDHAIDQAGEFFNRVALERLRDSLDADLENGDVAKALERREKFRRIELGAGEWVDVLRDAAVMEKAFADKEEPLVKFPGPLGRFFADSLERDGFVAISAPEKRGKSWALQEIAWRAMEQQRRVAIFHVGDLSQSQAMRRLMTRAAKRPLKPNRRGRPGVIEARLPKTLEMTDDGINIEYTTKEYKSPLSWQEASKACQDVIQKVKSNDSLLRLSVHPNSSISINGVAACLDRWERDGWSPDLVAIDYADILAPVNGAADTRDQINMTWKLMRRMSQERHCLVLTATQTNAASYEADLIRKKNFSEDKRKHAHVTAMLALNQSDTEKERGLMRLNWVDFREGDFSEREVVHVAGSLDVANLFMKSVWGRISS